MPVNLERNSKVLPKHVKQIGEKKKQPTKQSFCAVLGLDGNNGEAKKALGFKNSTVDFLYSVSIQNQRC